MTEQGEALDRGGVGGRDVENAERRDTGYESPFAAEFVGQIAECEGADHAAEQDGREHRAEPAGG
jgi:hypothetical protein